MLHCHSNEKGIRRRGLLITQNVLRLSLKYHNSGPKKGETGLPIPGRAQSVSHRLRQRLGQALDLLYPVTCLECDRPLIGPIQVCLPCRNRLTRLGARTCPLCSRPDTDPDHPCGSCQRSPPHFRRAVIRWRYAEPLAAWIRAFKYGNQPGLEATLADLLDTGLGTQLAEAGIDRVVAVPLHRRRLAERGYNQADRLARRIARRYRLPHRRAALWRTRFTPPQAALPERHRTRNVQGAFRTNPRQVAGGRILLVDDVITTGATADAAAAALLAGGAEAVLVTAVARA